MRFHALYQCFEMKVPGSSPEPPHHTSADDLCAADEHRQNARGDNGLEHRNDCKREMRRPPRGTQLYRRYLALWEKLRQHARDGSTCEPSIGSATWGSAWGGQLGDAAVPAARICGRGELWSRVLARRHAICYSPRLGVTLLIRGSSAVEQPAVNRLVVGSNPTHGATFQRITNTWRATTGLNGGAAACGDAPVVTASTVRPT
jgi:hypothetical protein